MKTLNALFQFGRRAVRATSLVGAWATLGFVVVPGLAAAEGSRSVYPATYNAAGARANLDVQDTGTYLNVVRRDAFLYVYARAGEYILTASFNRFNNSGGDIRIYNPQSFGTRGNETRPATIDFTCSGGALTGAAGPHYSGAGKGIISTRTAELAGPNSADNSVAVTNGYAPCAYKAPFTGIYGIQFTGATSNSAAITASIANPGINDQTISAWDVTVRSNSTSTTDVNGRLFTYAWIAYTGNNNLPLYSTFYYVTVDGYRYKQELQGLDPNGFALYANQTGFLDSGQPLYKDIRGSEPLVTTFPAGVTAQTAQYPIFFSDITPGGINDAEVMRVLTELGVGTAPPLPTVSNISFTGNVTGSTSSVGAGGTFQFTSDNTITFQIVISRDGIDFNPATTTNRLVTGFALSGTHYVYWDGQDNAGNDFPSTATYPYKLTGRNGEIHFPVVDAEANGDGGPTITKLNGTVGTTVYYDDRGYVTASGAAVGTRNSYLCGAATPAQPTPNVSLAGVNSNDPNYLSSGHYYRYWPGTVNANTDCSPTAGFGDAKGINLWLYESTVDQQATLNIVPAAAAVDVGVAITVPNIAGTGDTVYGSLVFRNDSSTTTATGVNYSLTLGNAVYCPPSGSVSFPTLAGGTYSFNAVTCVVSFTSGGAGLPATLTAGQSISLPFSYTAPATTGTVPAVATISAANETGATSPNVATGNTDIVANVDLAVAKTVDNATPTVGSNVTFSVAVRNFGPGTATGVAVNDQLPSGYSYVSHVVSAGTSYVPATGVWTVGTLANGGQGTLAITATVLATGSYANTASLTASTPTDTNASNNSATATPVPGTTADLAVVKSGPAQVRRNTSFTYRIVVSNAGPLAANNAAVKDPAVANFTANGVTCGSATGGAACPTVGNTTIPLLQGSSGIVIPTLPAGGSVALTVTGTAGASNGTITNIATVAPPAGITDSNSTNDTSTETTTIAGSTPGTNADVSVVKTGPSTVAAGGTVTYTLVVSNAGPSSANNTTVQDVLPAALTGTSITCSSAAGLASCPSGPVTIALLQGIGIVLDDLPSGGSVTFTVTGTAPATSMTFSNLASVSPPTNRTDPNLSNNVGGPVTTTVTANADVGIVKSGTVSVSPAGAVSYALVVANNGPNAANGTIVRDPAVANFTASTVTCGTATGGAACPTAGNTTLVLLQGSGIVVPTLPSGGRVTFTVTGTAGSSGTISNTASVTLPVGITDSNLINNSSTANTTISGPTLAVISAVRAYVENGRTWVEWETAAEIGTAGFNLLRRDPALGTFTRVNPRLLPSLIGAPQGGAYRYPDPAILPGATYTYGIEEVEATGEIRRHGPFTVTVGGSRHLAGTRMLAASATIKAASARADGFERTAHPPNGRKPEPLAVAQKRLAAATNATSTTMRILVEQDGLYAVGAEQIAAAFSGATLAKVKTWISKGQLRLQQQGQPVAWMADPSGDRLYFYGQAPQGSDSVYTRNNVYWLDQANGVTMKVVAGTMPTPVAGAPYFPSHVHAEQNVTYVYQFATDPDVDFWYWNYVYVDGTGDGPPQPFIVKAPDPAPFGRAKVRVNMLGATDLVPGNNHHAHLLVNGTEVGDITWAGIVPATLNAAFETALLAADGNNTFTVFDEQIPGVEYSVIYVDSFELDYPRYYRASGDQLWLRGAGNPVVTVGGFGGPNIAVLDVSSPKTPQWVSAAAVSATGTGNSVSFAPASPTKDYLAAIAKSPIGIQADTPSALKSKANGASYLALAPAALLDGATALAAYRGGMVVDLQDIYDEFNYGIANPNAVRDFLAYAAKNWKTKPRYVALVGKGTLDPKDYMGSGTNRFPVLMTPTPDGLFAADNRYVDFNNNGLPDIPVGRIPALTNDDVFSYLAKVAAYEGSSRMPANQAVLVADNVSDAGNFTVDSQGVAQALAAHGFTTTTAYMDEMSVDQARTTIIESLNSSVGAGVLNYVGHGGVNLLADEGLLTNADVEGLYNGTRLPLFLALTCNVGNGTYPFYDSLAETMLWRESGGAAATFASSALADNAQSHFLNLRMVDALFGPKASPTLGDAVVTALTSLAANGGRRYMLETYSIVGDPALHVQR